MEHEKLCRIREAIVSFFKLCEQEPTPESYSAWLKTLDVLQRNHLKKLGFEDGRHLISFQCYCLEQKGYFIDEFLKIQLSEDDFDYCLNIGAVVPYQETSTSFS